MDTCAIMLGHYDTVTTVTSFLFYSFLIWLWLGISKWCFSPVRKVVDQVNTTLLVPVSIIILILKVLLKAWVRNIDFFFFQPHKKSVNADVLTEQIALLQVFKKAGAG